MNKWKATHQFRFGSLNTNIVPKITGLSIDLGESESNSERESAGESERWRERMRDRIMEDRGRDWKSLYPHSLLSNGRMPTWASTKMDWYRCKDKFAS